MTSLLFFFLLTCKHAIADLALQARLTNKGSKLDLRTSRLWIHCLDHAVLTFFVALVFVGISKAIVIFILDFVVHFAIDYSKTYIQKLNKVKYSDRMYWNYAAVDQILHFATYFVIVLLAT
jgi:flagellar biosynthesis protein FlhB